MAEISSLEIGLHVNAEAAIAKIEQFKEKVSTINGSGSAAAKGMSDFKRSMESASAGAKKASKSFGTLGSMLKRIMIYRAIRVVLSGIANAFKTGITNMIEYSRIAGTDFVGAMNTAKSAATTWKNSLAAAVAPLISWFIPYLKIAVQWLVEFNNKLGAFFAAITGKSSYTAAIWYQDSYTSAIKGTTAAAKELQRYLAPFDELNVLPSNNGGGGGGGSSTPNYADMFEERSVVPLTFERISEFISNIAERLGELQGYVLSVAIDWAKGTWEKLKAKWKERVDEYDGSVWKITLSIVFDILSGPGAIADWIDQNIYQPWKNGLMNGLGLKDTDKRSVAGIVIDSLTSALAYVTPGIGPLFTTLKIGQALKHVFDEIDINELGETLKQTVGTWFNDLKSSLAEGWEVFKNDPTIQKIRDFFSNPLGTIDDFLSTTSATFQAKLHNFAANIWNSIVDAIKEKAPKLADWLNLDYMDTVEIPVTATITDRKIGPGFDPVVYGMTSQFGYKSLASGYDPVIYGMTSQFRYRNLASGYDPVIYGMTSQFSKRNLASSFPSTIYGMTASFSSAIIGGVTYNSIMVRNAGGGAFYGGMWHDIPQYASGGLPGHGSMFIAGEAGPELVGHINGRTEVLNASQIAASIAAGVSSVQTYSAPEVNEEVLYNAFLRALNDADIGGDTYLDGEALYRSVRKHNDMNTRMTGVNAFA